MPYRLRDNLYWCDCGGRLVFLDIEADRYFGLPSLAGETFKALAAGEPDRQSADRLTPLLAQGLLIEDPAASPLILPPIEPAAGDMLQGPCPSPGAVLIGQALFAELSAAWSLRRRTFHEVLKYAVEGVAGRASRSVDADDLLPVLISASMTVSLFLRATDRCLVRALAFHSICARHGIDCRLVFGVRLDPFTAHSWVQRGGKVLVGDYEQVRLFEPIAAFG